MGKHLERKDRLREFRNSMAEGFALVDADFTIVDVNDATVELHGRTGEELIGRSHWEALAASRTSTSASLGRANPHASVERLRKIKRAKARNASTDMRRAQS